MIFKPKPKNLNYIVLRETIEQGYACIVMVKSEDRELVEAYKSRKPLTEDEVKQMALKIHTRLKEKKGLDAKLIRENFVNLKKQRFIDTLRGRIT